MSVTTGFENSYDPLTSLAVALPTVLLIIITSALVAAAFYFVLANMAAPAPALDDMPMDEDGPLPPPNQIPGLLQPAEPEPIPAPQPAPGPAPLPQPAPYQPTLSDRLITETAAVVLAALQTRGLLPDTAPRDRMAAFGKVQPPPRYGGTRDGNDPVGVVDFISAMNNYFVLLREDGDERRIRITANNLDSSALHWHNSYVTPDTLSGMTWAMYTDALTTHFGGPMYTSLILGISCQICM